MIENPRKMLHVKIFLPMPFLDGNMLNVDVPKGVGGVGWGGVGGWDAGCFSLSGQDEEHQVL